MAWGVNDMIYLALTDASANPTLISQYGPLIAAVIALFGVWSGLILNGRRDRRRYQNEREDDYRRDQRAAIAALVVAGHNYSRECSTLADDPRDWDKQHRPADDALAALLTQLTLAKLLIHRKDLQAALQSMQEAWEATAKAMNEMEAAVRSHQTIARDQAADSLIMALVKYDETKNEVYTLAQGNLQPTVAPTRLRLRALLSPGRYGYGSDCRSVHFSARNTPHHAYYGYCQPSQVALV